MTLEAILSAIDEEISKLQQARAMLTNDATPVAENRLGRPQKVATVPALVKTAQKRVMSPDARARIAAAQKKRWAATKKATKK